MKRIIAILMLATTAHAQVWLGYTNEISGVTGPLLYTNFIAGQFRVTVAATDGGTPIDLSVDRVSLQVQDTRDNKLVVSNTCVTIDAYNYRGEGTLFASPEPYTLKVIVYPSGNPDANYPIYWASLTVTSAPSSGASVNVSVTTTANVTAASSGTGNVVTGITANGSVVTEHRGTVTGGGDSYPIAGVYPVGVTNYLGTSYVYLVSSGGIVMQPSIFGTNILQFGGPTSYFYSVPVDKNLIIVDSWTAAGGGYLGGAGSHSEIYIPVVGGEMLEFICGEAGLIVPATNASGFSTVRGGWPGGGIGVQRLNYGQLNGSGAGYNAIKRGTNYIYVGGGGGGGMTTYSGGAGGGVSGGNGNGSAGLTGVGGTQTAGGIAPTSSVPLAITNTAGGFLVGGDAGATTNLLAGASSGGGAGFRGGSGGLTANAANSRGTGAGGSSWANTNLVIYFSTTRGVGQTPPKQELPWYGSDIRGIGWGACVGTNGGNAGMVIREATM